jgi:hypothetical protein
MEVTIIDLRKGKKKFAFPLKRRPVSLVGNMAKLMKKLITIKCMQNCHDIFPMNISLLYKDGTRLYSCCISSYTELKFNMKAYRGTIFFSVSKA